MRCLSQISCCLMALACAACAGTIDDPASFEAYAAQSRSAGTGDASVPAPEPQLDAGSPEPDAAPDAAPEEEDAWVAPMPQPEADAGSAADVGTPGPVANACDFKGLM